MDAEQVFTEIYRDNIWGDGSPSSPRSGDGSKPENAKPYVQFVKSVINSYGIESVIDIGHGDWVMWKDYKFEDVEYIGIDVASGLSEEVGRNFGNSKRKFFHTSVFDSGLPKVDLIISKEVLQHLSNYEVVDKLKQFNSYKYLILSNAFYSNRRILDKIRYWIQPRIRLGKLLSGKNPFYTVKALRNNSDITTGDFRGLDLEAPPFVDQLSDFKIVDKFDYRGRKGSAVQMRTYFFARKDFLSK
jgi:hypothetical protein